MRQSWAEISAEESDLRNKGVVATEDKVVVDFEITDREPSYVQLIPLLSRIKKRLREDEIKLFQMRTGQL